MQESKQMQTNAIQCKQMQESVSRVQADAS